MAANPVPRHTGKLRSFAECLIQGLRIHEEALGVRQNTAAAIGEALAAAALADFGVGRALAARSGTYKVLSSADDAGLATLRNCKLWLTKHFGPRWNSSWEAAGFPDRSTAVPRTMDPRYTLLASLELYFTANPALDRPAVDASAALCKAAWTALREARFAANQSESALTSALRTRRAAMKSESALTSALRTRRAAMKALRSRCRGLIVELWVLMKRDDPRWADFGLNIPATREKKDTAPAA